MDATLPDHHVISIADDVELRLLAEAAVYWPARRTLFVADTHFGKGATFRSAGIPIPRGGTDGTLRVIEDLIERTGASRLVILGDMFHNRASLSRDVRRSMEGFFERQAATVRFALVIGNHDLATGRLPADWPVRMIAPEACLGPIAVAHHPGEPPAGAAVLLCGHLHPAIRLGGRRDALGKLPCFWFRDGVLVLPAIGELTGTHPIRPRRGDRVWVVADDRLLEHPVGD